MIHFCSKLFTLEPVVSKLDRIRPYLGFRRHFDEKANRLEMTVFVSNNFHKTSLLKNSWIGNVWH